MIPNDAELLQRYAKNRSPDAFAELVGRYLPMVFQAARRQVNGNSAAAEDIAQEVFCLLAKRASSLCRHRSLAGWCHTVTRNLSRELIRKERRRRARELEANAMNEILSGSEPAADWERLRPVIDGELGAMSETDREAVLLRFFPGLPLAEVGARLGVNENTARMRVQRAVERLRVRLARRGLVSTEAALSILLAAQPSVAMPVGLASAIVGTVASAPGMAAAGGILSFMSTTKSISMAATVGVMLAGGYAVSQSNLKRTAETELLYTQRELYNLALNTFTAERSVRAAVAQSEPGVDKTGVEEGGAVDRSESPFGPLPSDAKDNGNALMEAYPEIRAMLVQQTMARVGANLAPLFEELGLSKSEIEAVEGILIAGVTYSWDEPTVAGPFKRGVTPMRTVSLEAAPRLTDSEEEAQLRSVLGDSRYRRLVDYQESGLSLGTSKAAQLASVLYYTETPLTVEQARQFSNLYAATARSTDGPVVPEKLWASVRSQAEAFLQAPQVEAIGFLQGRDEFDLAISEALNATAY